MKLSEYKNEDALELLANIIDPLSAIISDKAVSAHLKRGGQLAKAVSVAIKNHKHEVFEVLAALDGVPVDEYECGVFTLPAKLIEVLNDKEMLDFFGLQGTKEEAVSFGSATENTKVTETE